MKQALPGLPLNGFEKWILTSALPSPSVQANDACRLKPTKEHVYAFYPFRRIFFTFHLISDMVCSAISDSSIHTIQKFSSLVQQAGIQRHSDEHELCTRLFLKSNVLGKEKMRSSFSMDRGIA